MSRPVGEQIAKAIRWCVGGILLGACAGVLFVVVYLIIGWLFLGTSNVTTPWSYRLWLFKLFALMYGLGGAAIGGVVGLIASFVKPLEQWRE